jgi:hypothetical protein
MALLRAMEEATVLIRVADPASLAESDNANDRG